mmetsp:Transcript_17841/g.36814  ORF Transcript_17841/g.36814 Transcript_17841/m.36814 type:complete len:210 (-) Transcript_17841:621-1250(-)
MALGCVVDHSRPDGMISLEARSITAPSTRTESDQVSVFVSSLIPIPIHYSTLVVRAGEDGAKGFVRDVVDEFEGQSGEMKVGSCKDEVHQFVCFVLVVGILAMTLVEGHGLHRFNYMQALLWRGTRRTGGNVVLDVFMSLVVTGDIAARTVLHLTHVGAGILEVEGVLHEDLVLRFLRTLGITALFVRVDQEHTVLAAAPSADVGGEVA